MRPYAFYHDHDQLKCETVREAIKAKAITDGEVVCGDIKQLAANDVRGFRRAHFFCGGGFWDLALNLAQWGDGPVWTGSCPCPSFSAAGKGGGFDDPRHLWPVWQELIRECRPPVVFGEQADDAVGYGWLDLVQTDLEAQAYAVGKVIFGAHSVGAPHIRQRLYFVGSLEHAASHGYPERSGIPVIAAGRQAPRQAEHGSSKIISLEHAAHERCGEAGRGGGRSTQRPGDAGEPLELEHAAGDGRDEWRPEPGGWSVAGGCGAVELEQPVDARPQRHSGHGPGGHQPGRLGEITSGPTPEADVSGGVDHAEGSGCQCQPHQRSARTECAGVCEAGCGCESGASGATPRRVDDTFAWGREQGRPGDGSDEREHHGSAGQVGELAYTDGAQEYAPTTGGLHAQPSEYVPVGGFWREAEWIPCRNPKVPGAVDWRPIERGTFPLAARYPGRLAELRLAGDAICVPQAQAFIEAYRSLKEESYAHPAR